MKITPKYVLTGLLIVAACVLAIWLFKLGFNAGAS